MTSETKPLIPRPVFYTLVGAGTFLGIMYLLGGILAPILLAFLLAYLFDPLVGFLARKKIPRAAGSAICLVIMLIATTSLAALILPALQKEIRSVAGKLPVYARTIQESGIPWVEGTFGIDLPETISEALTDAQEQLAGNVGGKLGKLAGPVSSLLKGMLSGTLNLLSKLIYLIIIPLFMFYFLKDYQQIVGWFSKQIPPRFREQVGNIFVEVDEVLAGFVRGQLTVCSILAIVYSVALSIIGVNAAITIGIIAGLFNLVPYLGTVTGLMLSFLFLLLEGAGWMDYAVVAGLFVIISTLDGLLMTPRILGNKLGLAPVVVILAILAFGEVFGFVGVLMAVPATAVGKVLARRALEAYRASRLYQGGDGADQAA